MFQSSTSISLDLHLLGGILYPWRFRATLYEEIIVADPVIQTRQWRTSSPTNSDRINSQSHLTYYGSVVAFKTEASNVCFVVSP